MNRRTVICALGSWVVGWPLTCHAQRRPFGVLPGWGAWKKIPSIVVVSDEDDPRLPAVGAAVGFWNETFSALGSPFRLGPVTHLVGMIAADELRSFWTRNRHDLPESVRHVKGEVLIALSHGNHAAFANRSPTLQKAVVAFQSSTSSTKSPEFARLVIAHELGHVIGLGHNDHPSMLMCGTPAGCYPDVLGRYTGGPLRLTEREKVRLLDLYPPDWTEVPQPS